MATDYNSPLYIGNEMAAFDRKDRKYYDKFTDEERKQFSTYLMLRYGASIEGSVDFQSYYLLATNENVNKYFFDLNKHPKLQWLMCTTVSPNMGKQKHYWQGAKKKENNNKAVKFLTALYPQLKDDEIKLLAELNDKRDLTDMARKLGWMTNESSPSYKCKYCGKEYRKESTLAAHLCESKRRWQQEKEVGVQIGLQSYLRFFELTQGSAKLKSYSDFVESPYYNAFVKFGRHIVAIRAVNPRMFIEYVIKENKKLDHWTHEKVYLEYLHAYLKKEAVQDALERALIEMQEYADEIKTLASFKDYFRYGNANRICHHISNGRISPWIVFNCDSGVEFLGNLSEEHIAMVMPWIDPDFWQRKFSDYVADTEWIKMILKEAGL